MSDILNPKATVTIALKGLAVCCHNNREKRWEIAVPHFSTHFFSIEIPGIGLIEVPEETKLIEIKTKNGKPPSTPAYQVNPFKRTDKTRSHPLDYRWVTEFTNKREIPHGTVSVKSHRVKVTLLHIYDAVFYTKSIGNNELVCTKQEKTCPTYMGEPHHLPVYHSGPELEAAKTWGHAANILGMDIECQPRGEVDIVFEKGMQIPIKPAKSPTEITFINLEPPHGKDYKMVRTHDAHYGLGDFFRYYELFQVSNAKHHLWEKYPLDSNRGIMGDCNGVRVDSGTFGALLANL